MAQKNYSVMPVLYTSEEHSRVLAAMCSANTDNMCNKHALQALQNVAAIVCDALL